jgi:methyl-accepting chemotaxis protein
MAWLRMLRKRFSPRRLRVLGHWPGWLKLLAAARQDLAELNLGTERDFLQVGEQLQRFLEVAGRMAEQCAHLVGVLSGNETARGAEDLRSILERARAMTAHAETIRMALEQMLDDVGRVTNPLADLNAKMRSFRVMATLIRIEGSRLDQAGVDFETLAEDVRKLATDIEENGKAVLDGSLALGNIVREAGSGVAQFEARQRVELPRIRQQAEVGLAALLQRRASASDVTRAMAASYESVRQEIGGLVTSLQFHDITRQQIEHAAAALEETRGMAAGEVSLLIKVCRLQNAQLGHARDAFLAAVSRVKECLGGIAGNVLQMAEQTSSVLAGGQDSTFLSEMEHGFGGIRAALSECADSRYCLSKVAETVAQGVKEMAGFVAAIEEIGFRMQRIALNANIKAIRIGEQGSALGAVANAIQRLAAESTCQTEVVAQGIRAVAIGSNRLSAELMDCGEGLTGELERVIAAFHTADGENRERLQEIGECGRSFSQELETLRAAIQVDQLVASVSGRSRGRLDEVVTAAEPLASDDEDLGAHDLLRGLESQYTMHAERAVHQQATGEDVAAALGANVELF